MLDLLGVTRIFRNGVEQLTRKAINFVGTGVIVTDDPANNRINVEIDGGGGGTGDGTVTGPETSTVGHVATFGSTDGTELADGAVALADLATKAYVDAHVPAGAGDVVGPSSAVDDRLAAFNGTTGKLIEDSGISAADVATFLASVTSSAPIIYQGHFTDPWGPRSTTNTYEQIDTYTTIVDDIVSGGIVRTAHTTFTVPRTGFYRAYVAVNEYGYALFRCLRVRKNGVTVLSQNTFTGASTSETAETPLYGMFAANAGDSISFEVLGNTASPGWAIGSLGGELCHIGNLSLEYVQAPRLVSQAAPAASPWIRVADVNFTQAAARAFTGNGATVIDGLTWTLENIASVASLAIDANGLRWTCNAVNSERYPQDPSNATCLKVKLADACPGFILGSSRLRMFWQGYSNGNANHEVLRCGLDRDPFSSGLGQNIPAWVWNIGAFDNVAPHRGVYSIVNGPSGFKRYDLDYTAKTPNDSTLLYGIELRDLGEIDFFYGATAAVDTDSNDVAFAGSNIKLGASLRTPSGVSTAFADPVIADYETAYNIKSAADLAISLSGYTVNTAAHAVHTLKRMRIEYIP
jgi:hypothetical protein